MNFVNIGIMLLAALALPLAGGIGAYEGYRHGRKGTTLRATCIRSWSRSIAVLTIIFTLLFAIVGAGEFMSGTAFSEALSNFTFGIVLSLAFSCLITAIPAPIAAFIAHNFGTQRRIRDDLAKPPES